MIDKATGKIVGQHTTPGHFNWSMGFGNPTYILCLSDAAVDLAELTRRFGNHVVEVFSPRDLCERLHASAVCLALNDRTVASVEWFAVRYDKGMVGSHPDDESWRVRIAYGQKAPKFAVEREYRCAVVLSGPIEGSPEHLDLVLGEVGSFARPYRLAIPGVV